GSSLFRIETAPERKEVEREFHTAVAELLDSDGHLYQPVVEVTFRYREASETTWSYSQPMPTDGGVATWTEFTVTKAGVYEVEAWTTSGQVGTTQRAEFKPGDISVERTLASLEVSRSAAFANGLATVEAVMTARDRFDNSIPGVTLGFETMHDVPFGAIFAGNGLKTIEDVSGADGKVRVYLTSQAEGKFDVRGWVLDTSSPRPYQQASFTLDVVASDKSEFSVARTEGNESPDKAIANGRDSYTATIVLRNADSVPINGVSGTVYFTPIDRTDISEQPIDFVTGTQPNRPVGEAQVPLTTLKAGKYRVSVKIGAADVATQPGGSQLTVEVDYVAGPPVLANARWDASQARVLSDGMSTHWATVWVEDANRNLVPDHPVTFQLDPAGSAFFVSPAPDPQDAKTITVRTSALGVAHVTVANNVPETVEIVGSLSIGEVGRANFLFTTEGPSAAHSNWTVATGTRVADDRDSFLVTVTVRDSSPSHLLVPNVPVSFTLPPGVRIEETDLTTNDQGELSVHIVSTKSGPQPVSASVGGGRIPPETRTLQFVPGVVAPNFSTLHTTTSNVPSDGETAHAAWVIVRDRYSNPVPGAQVSFEIEDRTAVPGPVLDGGTTTAVVTSCDPSATNQPSWCEFAGQALVYITSREPGTFEVSGKLAGVHVNDSPGRVTFASGPADPGHSLYAITPLATGSNAVTVTASGLAQDAYTLTVEAFSAADLPVEAAQVRLIGLSDSVNSDQPRTAATGLASSDHFGAFTWKLTSTVAAEFRGQVQVNTARGWQNVGTEFLVRFNAGPPNPGYSQLSIPTAAGGATKVADNVQTHQAVAALEDGEHNPVPNHQVRFEWSYQGPSGEVRGTGTATSDDDGLARFDFASPVAGVWTIDAFAATGRISNSPQQARFVTGTPSDMTSELTSPAQPARANGEGSQVVTAWLRDTLGSPASCWNGLVEIPCTVTFRIPTGTWTMVGTDRRDGPVSVSLPAGLSGSPTAGQVSITVYGVQGQWHVYGSVGSMAITKADGVTSLSPDGAPARVRFTDATPPEVPAVRPPNGESLRGQVPEEDLEDAAAGELEVIVIDPATDEEIARCPVDEFGRFACDLPNLPDGMEVVVIVEDLSGNRSSESTQIIDAIPPDVPPPTPSAGADLSGIGLEVGNQIIVRDADGTELCRTEVEEGLIWRCDLEPDKVEGDHVVIEEEDPATNVTTRPWRIGVPRIAVTEPTRNEGDTQTVTGENFQPGEEVTAVMHSDPYVIGTTIADADGRVTFTWKIPAGTPDGVHTVELSGPLSGSVIQPFNVAMLVFTGVSGIVPTVGVAAGAILAGWWLLLLAARRRRREEQTA
ncbi:MAG: Ig-like domain-containing protein, partial [Bifidobacteriaceae bacterium]|nr:Ig-like domain-containing protein [Bifidobacteriaceae bacterium]